MSEPSLDRKNHGVEALTGNRIL